ncbi:TonB-dependent receptor [Methylobacillus methanolivorans]
MTGQEQKKNQAGNHGSLMGVGMALLLAAMPVVAEEAQPDNAAAKSSEAAADEGVALGTVTVTVRRREESGQSVPTSLTSVTGADLADRKISQVQDLQQVLPSANAAFMHARVSSVAVRGIGSNPANEGLEASVGIYVDNVYYARPGMLAIDLIDLEQVDLIRGPQGTLFGKNTTGGVLNLTTKKPTFTPEKSLEFSAGNRGYYQTLATISGPISDTVAGRLSFAKTHDDGWIKNVSNGKRLNSIDRDGVRGQLLIKPDETFDLRLIADYNREDDSQGTLVPYGFGPVRTGSTWQQLVAGWGGQPLITDPKKYKVNIDSRQRVEVNQGGLSAEANWHLPSGFDFTSITAWRTWQFDPHNDADFTTVNRIENTGFHVDHNQVSQELRLASPKGEHFDYVVGTYLYYQKIKSDYFVDPGSTPLGVSKIRTYGESTTNSYSLFGQSNWHLTPRLDLTTGLRGTYEIKKGSTYQTLPTTAAWDSGNLEVTNFSPSILASLNYQFTPNIMGYGLVAQSEKSGGINISGVGAGRTAGANSLKIDPERARNVELGVKSTWFEKRLFANVNLFQTRIYDYQTTGYILDTNGLATATLTNAGDAKSYGLEFDIKTAPVRGLSFNLNGAYNHARYTSFDNAPCSAEAAAAGKSVCDLTGKPLVGAPDWTVNTGGRYDWLVGDSVNQYLVVNYSWRSEAEGSIDTSRYARIPSYGLLNFSTGWQFTTGKHEWDISLWAKNALDKHYFLTALPSLGGGYIASTGAPRTVGITARLDF